MRWNIDSEKKPDKKVRRYSLVIAFLFPVLTCCTGFAAAGVFPFGSRSALIIDGVHQYLGFYEELLHQIGQGVRWTFSGHAMGYSFYSLFSYYLSSPFNLLILLLMQFLYVNEAVTLVMLVKIGLTGTCMAWYVQKKGPGMELAATGMGCAYALSNYVLGYYSNLMWLDCVMLLPVLAWTIEHLAETGRWRRYTLVLGYCIFSNYYIGFILCIFSALYYVAVCFGMAKKKDRQWKSCVKFAGASILSGGTAAVILIPAVSAIAKTTAAKQAGISGVNGVYGDIWKQLGRLMFDSYPYATSGDQASINLYCGCAALLFAALFFLNRGIRWQKKAAMAALLFFYFAGFHIRALNLLLHGMHKPAGMPNRFAFVFIFLLLSAAAEGWGRAGKIGKKERMAGLAVCLIFCAAIGIKTADLKITGTCGFILLYFFLLTENAGIYRQIRRQKLVVFLLLCEIGVHSVLSICSMGTANRNLYEESGKELRQAVSTLQESENGRTVIVNPQLRNEELLYQLNGVSMFSSTNTDSMQVWMRKMGFETGNNRFQYAGETELMDMLLGIRYLACRNTIRPDTPYTKVHGGRYFDLYENPRALAEGYLADSGIRDFRLDGKNPFENQNNLLQKMGVGTLYQTREISPLPKQGSSKESVFELRLEKGSGTIRADRDGVLFFSAFYDQGIHVKIDGQEAPALDLEGMLGVRINKGRHTVSLSYETPGLKAGIAVSLLSLGMAGAYPAWKWKHKRKAAGAIRG